ncbi:hypothetical protein SDC9_82385 [bioreactor metagenome]|uniref:Uncharacterized protein n=1 Tax=bioreactor metagenome TaxID=1076179 RepID=A0A644Z706_9ZZZZ
MFAVSQRLGLNDPVAVRIHFSAADQDVTVPHLHDSAGRGCAFEGGLGVIRRVALLDVARDGADIVTNVRDGRRGRCGAKQVERQRLCRLAYVASSIYRACLEAVRAGRHRQLGLETPGTIRLNDGLADDLALVENLHDCHIGRVGLAAVCRLSVVCLIACLDLASHSAHVIHQHQVVQCICARRHGVHLLSRFSGGTRVACSVMRRTFWNGDLDLAIFCGVGLHHQGVHRPADGNEFTGDTAFDLNLARVEILHVFVECEGESDHTAVADDAGDVIGDDQCGSDTIHNHFHRLANVSSCVGSSHGDPVAILQLRNVDLELAIFTCHCRVGRAVFQRNGHFGARFGVTHDGVVGVHGIDRWRFWCKGVHRHGDGIAVHTLGALSHHRELLVMVQARIGNGEVAVGICNACQRGAVRTRDDHGRARLGRTSDGINAIDRIDVGGIRLMRTRAAIGRKPARQNGTQRQRSQSRMPAAQNGAAIIRIGLQQRIDRLNAAETIGKRPCLCAITQVEHPQAFQLIVQDEVAAAALEFEEVALYRDDLPTAQGDEQIVTLPNESFDIGTRDIELYDRRFLEAHLRPHSELRYAGFLANNRNIHRLH